VKCNPKQPSCKKGCGTKKIIVKKDVKSKVAAKKWKLMAKFLITTIQVNLVPNPSEMWRRRHKFTWIVVIKNFAISLLYHHSYFFVATLDFTSFFTMAFLGPHPFLQLGFFGLDLIMLRSLTQWPMNTFSLNYTSKDMNSLLL